MTTKEVYIINSIHGGNRCIICQEPIHKGKHIQLGRYVRGSCTRVAGRFKLNWRKIPVKLHMKCALGIEDEIMTVLARGYKNRIKPSVYPNPDFIPTENNNVNYRDIEAATIIEED